MPLVPEVGTPVGTPARIGPSLSRRLAEVIEVEHLSTDLPSLLTIPDAAGVLGVSVSTVRRLVRYRYLGAVRVGRSVRIERSEVARYITENTRPAL